jgi:ribosomal protein L37E
MHGKRSQPDRAAFERGPRNGKDHNDEHAGKERRIGEHRYEMEKTISHHTGVGASSKTRMSEPAALSPENM